METLESDTQETLEEGETNLTQGVSRVSGSYGSNPVQTGLGLPSEVPLPEVSFSKKDSNLVETEISVGKIGENGIGDNILVVERDSTRDESENCGMGCDAVERSLVNGGVVDVSKMSGDSLENRENGEVLAVNEDGKDEIEKKILVDKKIFDRVDLGTKIEVMGDNIPLIVEVHGNLVGGAQMVSDDNPISDREVEEENEEELDEEEETYDEERKYSVGDFVWGKIKSHPWWPGQIYNPSDASKIAAGYQRRDRYLVAYFGDGTFAWCYPSQLKPFQENFNTMAKQSISKSFVKAVEEAVDEIGRRVELEMTCSCVGTKIPSRLIRPLAVNAGIKVGVPMPEARIGELSISLYEPIKFLERLCDIAQVVSTTGMLELTVFKSQLSVFYRAKGFSKLPMYHEPRGITDPLDNAGNGLVDNGDFEGQAVDLTAGPTEEDWLSSPISSRRNGQKWPGISEAKLYHRKKKRSMAELMANDMDDVAEEETVSGKLKSVTKKRKKNNNSKTAIDNEATEEGSGGSKRMPPSKKWKEEGSKSGPVLRERKKSKYLSPPYTDVRRGRKRLVSIEGPETDTPNVPKVSTLGDCMIRAANQVTGAAPIVKCSETFWKKSSKKSRVGPPTPKEEDHEIDIVEIKASAREMLLDFRSAALNPLYLKEKRSDTIKDFFTRLRSSLYHDGSDFMIYNKYLSGRGSRKRVSLITKLGSPGIIFENDHPTATKGKSEQKKRKMKGDAVLQSPKKKKKSKSKSNHDDDAKGAALLLTFSPGVSLPSKDDLVSMFGKFGTLNESETEVLKDSCCARVVYTRSSDAEEAYNSSAKTSPFGPAVASYRLRYLSSAHPPSKGGDDDPSFLFVKEKLKTTTSLLENLWDKLSQEVKANLEGEVKALLNKVTSMVESHST